MKFIDEKDVPQIDRWASMFRKIPPGKALVLEDVTDADATNCRCACSQWRRVHNAKIRVHQRTDPKTKKITLFIVNPKEVE